MKKKIKRGTGSCAKALSGSSGVFAQRGTVTSLVGSSCMMVDCGALFGLSIANGSVNADMVVDIACPALGIDSLEVYVLDNLTVFGDSDNDAEMFRLAPHAIATANATKEIHTLATETIGPNSEDSVVSYLSEHC